MYGAWKGNYLMILTVSTRTVLKNLQLKYLMSIYLKLLDINEKLTTLGILNTDKFIYLDNNKSNWYLISNLDCNEYPIHVRCSSLEEALYFYCRFYIEYILFKTLSSRKLNKIIRNEIDKIWPEPRYFID